MTFVREVIAGSMRAGSMLPVNGSGSTGTSIAPHWLAASQVAMYVLEGTMTSSPNPTSMARKASCNASNPSATPIA